MTQVDDSKGLRVNQVARHLGLSDGYIRNLAHSGELPSYRTERGHRRFLMADVLAFDKRRARRLEEFRRMRSAP